MGPAGRGPSPRPAVCSFLATAADPSPKPRPNRGGGVGAGSGRVERQRSASAGPPSPALPHKLRGGGRTAGRLLGGGRLRRDPRRPLRSLRLAPPKTAGGGGRPAASGARSNSPPLPRSGGGGRGEGAPSGAVRSRCARARAEAPRSFRHPHLPRHWGRSRGDERVGAPRRTPVRYLSPRLDPPFSPAPRGTSGKGAGGGAPRLAPDGPRD
jgi:hypothetical protein